MNPAAHPSYRNTRSYGMIAGLAGGGWHSCVSPMCSPSGRGKGGAIGMLTVELLGPLRVSVAGRPVELPAGVPGLAELAGLAEQYPLRESLWVRLLRVLESAGRPAEALERYETIRRRLAEELGADPSPELRQVHADLLAGGVPSQASASLAGVPVSAVRAPLAELTRASLLTEHPPGRHSCHDLLRAYATELCEAGDPDRDAARHRIVDHYVHTAYAAALCLDAHTETIGPAAPGPGVSVTEFAGPDASLTWCAAERPALLATLQLATELGLDRHVCHLAWALFVLLHPQGHWHDRAETQRTAVAAARRLGDPVEESRAHRDLAIALADLGRFGEAHHHLDAALARSHDDPAGQAWTHYHRDIVYAIQGREADALDAARRATTSSTGWATGLARPSR